MGFISSLYFYEQTQKSRKPIFLYDPIKAEIFDKENINKAPITVLKANGELVRNDVVSVKFFFWNEGEESIRTSNILEDIFIYLGDSESEILSFKLLSVSRELIDASLTHVESDNGEKIRIDFKILEYKDGMTGQIIYEGDKETELLIVGSIEGVKKIIIENDILSINKWYAFALFSLLLIMSSISGYYFGKFPGGGVLSLLLSNKLDGVHNVKNSVIILAWISLVILLFLLVWLLNESNILKKTTDLIKSVPSEILPR